MEVNDDNLGMCIRVFNQCDYHAARISSVKKKQLVDMCSSMMQHTEYLTINVGS